MRLIETVPKPLTALLAGLLLCLISLDGRAGAQKGNDRIMTGTTSKNEQELDAFKRRAASDPLRPRFHYAPPVFWMNDPNGLIQYNGVYHLFYQYCLGMEKPYPGGMHWGHARSTDLLHWTDLPIALSPDKTYGDICSGGMVNDNGVPTAVYTAGPPQQQCIATSGPDLIQWQKYEGNPVIAEPPADLKTSGFRDPTVWKEGNEWIMGVGSGIKGQGGTILIYRSTDLRKWEYLNPLHVGDKNKSGTMWECPSFFPLGDKHVLIVSALTLPYYAPEYHPDPPAKLNPAFYKTMYFIGTYKDHRFTPEYQSDMDLWPVEGKLGGDFYAPQTFADEKRRRVLIGWSLTGRDAPAMLVAGWEGVMTLPRELTLGPDSRLRIKPVDEILSLRRHHRHYEGLTISPGATDLLGGLKGDPIEIEAVIEPGKASQVGLLLRRSPNGQEETRLYYDAERQQLAFDRERSSLNKHVKHDGRAAAFPLAPGETLRLRVIVDRSIVEVYVNERAAGTFRIYPTRPDSLGVDLYARGGTAKIRSLDAWELE